MRKEKMLRHICESCGLKFRAKAKLAAHLRNHISKGDVDEIKIKEQLINTLKPLKCNYCEMRFSRKSDFDQHENTHTGSTPYSCELCSEAFQTRAQLRPHMKKCHAEERQFECEVYRRRKRTNQGLSKCAS